MDESDYDQYGPAPDEPADKASLAREQQLAAIRDFRERMNSQPSPPGSLTLQYVEERRALRHLFPGTLADLARDGIVKVRLFGEDGWEDVPERPQPGS